MSRTVQHMCQSVRGALLNWKPRDYCNIRDADGRPMTPREVKAALLDHLAKGHEVIPFGEPCEGFDYSGGGCPGHDVPEGEAS